MKAFSFLSLEAVKRGNLSEIKALLEPKDSHSVIWDNGNTPLLQAAACGHLEVVRWLLQEGHSYLDEKDSMGLTALLHAASCGHLEVLKWLLTEAGSQATEKDHFGYTVLLWAACRGYLEVVQWLLRKEGQNHPISQITEENNDGKTALLIAANGGYLDMLQWLLAHGGSKITERNQEGRTALLLAAQKGYLPVVQWLVEKGGSRLLEKDQENKTALLLAAQAGYLEVVQWLLGKNASQISQKDKTAKTALLLAAQKGHAEMVQWLLEKGGSRLDERDHAGETVFSWMTQDNSLGTLRWVLGGDKSDWAALRHEARPEWEEPDSQRVELEQKIPKQALFPFKQKAAALTLEPVVTPMPAAALRTSAAQSQFSQKDPLGADFPCLQEDKDKISSSGLTALSSLDQARADYQAARDRLKAGDTAQALVLFARAAEAGYPRAQGQLGAHYLKTDKTLARDWFEKAAAGGHAPSQINLGLLYVKGDGVPKDIPRALDYLKQAMSQKEDLDAQQKAAVHYAKYAGRCQPKENLHSPSQSTI
jgi:ankyrin repeat protein